ncbi:hypothetical protein [Luteolibacter sp. Populi]|uniref:right-handed parallel beta-helix repeat-containing protein n=1 Tax=Luteolibacter sp. Populi TaxID=3230487 RepID=UPI003466B437
MKMRSSLCFVLMLPSVAFSQGPVEPPAGPPVPSMRTLDQIESRRPLVAGTTGVAIAPAGTITISQGGSYYLTGNLAVTTGNGIAIAADDVTLDLNGFSISSASASSTGTAILLSGSRSRIGISNGHVRSGATYQNNPGAVVGPGFANGIWADGAAPDGARVSNLSITGVTNFGIWLGAKSSCIVQGCSVNQVGAIGIRAGVVTDCTATMVGTFDSGLTIQAERISNSTGTQAAAGNANGMVQISSSPEEAGIKTGLAATASRIAVGSATTPGTASSEYRITSSGSYFLQRNLQVTSSGKVGIEIAAAGVTLDLMGFTLSGTAGTLDGIRSTGFNDIVIRNGRITGFAGDGIDLRNGVDSRNCLIEEMTVSGNSSHGIITNTAGRVRNCIASGNGINGFWLWEAGSIESCTASRNLGDGVHAEINCSVSRCSSSENTLHGIYTLGNCFVRDNQCNGNGFSGFAAGIACSGAGTRIEGNSCANQDIGIRVYNGGNLIVRNTCNANLNNWSINENNSFGVILDRTVVTTPFVNGNAAAAAPATTDPNANFSY